MTSPLTACTGMPDRVISATRSACRVRASAVTNSSETRAPLRKASETACGPSARKARARCRSARLVSRRAALSRGLRTLVYSEPLPSGSGTASLGRQVRPGHLDQRGERGLVGHGQLGQHAPVHFDLGRLQALDEAVVGDAVGPGGRVDALDPQPPEGALAVLAVAVGVGHRVELLLLGLAVQPGPLAPVAAGPLKDGAALLLGVGRPLDACHVFVTPSASARERGYLPSSFLISRMSFLATALGPSSRRVMRDDLCSSRWFFPARRRITLPVPVSLNRFAVPLWVFIFGMVAVVSLVVRARRRVPYLRASGSRAWHRSVRRGSCCPSVGRDLLPPPPGS